MRAMLVACVLVLAGCGGRVTRDSNRGGSELSQSTFQFPADGETGSVGPFCCTGKTVTVRDRDGQTRGHAYFYDFGPAYNQGDTSYSTSFTILIADADGNTAGIEFEANDVHDGDSKTAQVGDLVFTLFVTRVDTMSASSLQVFDMGTLAVQVSVATA